MTKTIVTGMLAVLVTSTAMAADYGKLENSVPVASAPVIDNDNFNSRWGGYGKAGGSYSTYKGGKLDGMNSSNIDVEVGVRVPVNKNVEAHVGVGGSMRLGGEAEAELGRETKVPVLIYQDGKKGPAFMDKTDIITTQTTTLDQLSPTVSAGVTARSGKVYARVEGNASYVTGTTTTETTAPLVADHNGWMPDHKHYRVKDGNLWADQPNGEKVLASSGRTEEDFGGVLAGGGIAVGYQFNESASVEGSYNYGRGFGDLDDVSEHKFGAAFKANF